MNKLILWSLVCLPLRHLSLTSSYGYRIHPLTKKYSFHSGVDLRAHKDTVFAVLAGRVKSAGYDPFLGVNLRLTHGAFETSYGHLSQIFVLPGHSVTAGDAIGISGSTGRVTGEHLHFSVSFNHKPINPLIFLEQIINQK